MAMVKLGDVAIEKRETWTGSTQGVPIVGLEHLVPGEITLSSWDSDTDNTFSKMFRKDQVLLGRRRVYLKKAVIAPFDGICSGDITVIETIPGKISSRLLPFIIQNERFFDYAMQGSAGSLSPRVKWEHLKDYEFNLPDHEEQESLANKLWSALKLKESYHSLLLATDEMVKSRFIEIFGDLTKNTKSIPITTIGELFEVGSSKRVFEKDWTSSGVPFYRAREIVKLAKDGFVDNELFITESMYEEYSRKYGIPVVGDIMVTGVGTLGVCYLVREGDRFYYKDGNTICLHSLGKIDSRFVVECYGMPFVIDQIEGNANVTTVGTYTIDKARKTRIPWPSPRLQNLFLSTVYQADKSKFELKQAIEKIDKVMRALLQ